MHPGIRRSASASALALLCLALAACESGNGGGSGAQGQQFGDGESSNTSDSDGDTLAGGSLKIVKIDRTQLKTQGTVTYTVKNVSPGSPKDLLWSVTFLYDPPEDTGEIRMPVLRETSDEFSLYLASGEDVALTLKSGAFASRPQDSEGGRGVRGTRMSAYLDPPVLGIAREGKVPGTKFVGGQLECIQLSSLWDDPSRLVVDLENISSTAVPDLRYELIVTMDETETRSSPVTLPAVGPGQTVKVTADMSGVTLGNRSYKLKVVPKKLKT